MNTRITLRGLHLGQRVRVTGAGRFARGTVSTEPGPEASHVFVRCDWSGGERLFPVERIHAERRLR